MVDCLRDFVEHVVVFALPEDVRIYFYNPMLCKIFELKIKFRVFFVTHKFFQ